MPEGLLTQFDISQKAWHIQPRSHLFRESLPLQHIASFSRRKTACSNCNLAELCLPVDFDTRELQRLDELNLSKCTFAKGEPLFRSGSPFKSLYAIHNGSFKTTVPHEEGHEQVTGFFMMGEIIGMDAISTEKHTCDAVAMEDSEVCELPFNRLEALSHELPSLQRNLYKIMSREIVRDQGIMLLLGSMRAEQRLAAFLLNLSQRYAARGYSLTAFQLRMSREDLGSYLGLKLETVSRAFSHLHESGLIKVQNRAIEILDLAALKATLTRP